LPREGPLGLLNTQNNLISSNYGGILGIFLLPNNKQFHLSLPREGTLGSLSLSYYTFLVYPY